MDIKNYLATAVVSFSLGFLACFLFVGRNIEESTDVDYIDRPPITVRPDTIPPSKDSIPENIILPPDIFPKKEKKEKENLYPYYTPSDDMGVITTLRRENLDLEQELEQLRNGSMRNDSLSIYRAVYWDYVKIKDSEIVYVDNDSVGKITGHHRLQFNRFLNTSLDLELKEKVTTVNKSEKMFFYGTASYITPIDYLGIGGGFFYKNWGAEYQYLNDIRGNNNGHMIGGKYKFRLR